ncbi:tRNA lysidine(34) synthetase TilS [Wenzhouxiangella sp. AB-CW3]|uniref:tRNA lysidine(34) synthetase TilS n=1 Tax=Wenzhouxiangella sp. AB-CW3 TaxID=2771012 RepID=UPI00168A96E9|nr:tRNA lysidine(34) synthetase TilS [Wenzhouxiangella sp. AB-CW3]QOC21136.1 tRNA lysidine(34) synthetase TilS [Wenzhouxiangella sp. AB-CW3]
MPDLNPHPKHWPGDGRALLAFSGGPDSLCLLHCLRKTLNHRRLICVHVDHRLDPDSGKRAQQARAMAEAAGIECVVLPGQHHAGPGPEASARQARYRALEEFMDTGDILLTAHHADDQAETVLLRLLRGASPAGLSGIPRLRRFAGGWLARPLLDWTREDIERHLDHLDLDPLHDPANDDPAFDRNIIRHQVLPEICRHWPGARRALRRTGRLCAGATETLAVLTREDLDTRQQPDLSLSLEDTGNWPAFRIGEMIRQWCHDEGLDSPPGRRVERFVDQLRDAAGDRQPQLSWSAGHIRSWRKRLWLSRLPDPPETWSCRWTQGQRLQLPGKLGSLRIDGATDPPLPLEVRSGRAGERLKVDGSSHHRKVGQLLAEAGVPPWERPHWPRIWLEDQLAGVGERWLSTPLREALDQARARLIWETASV